MKGDVPFAQAGVLVSSKDDLLVLNPWRGVPVLRPAGFLTYQGAQ